MTRPDTDDYLQIFLKDACLMDVRAPVEFDRGAFEHATNLPLMSDEERHQVGIRYQQAGQDAAIALGRKLVDQELQHRRTESWIDFAKTNPEGYLYCFRGGLRSRISQQWMAESVVEFPYIQGGYKSMRRFLIDRFSADINSTPLVLISGRTGTGKTLLLNRICRSLDLEGMANHRGSSFGSMANAQPTPINFENVLSVRMLKLCARQPEASVFVEGEGRLVGRLTLPDVLWNKMQHSPTLVLEADMERRIEIGLNDYVIDLFSDIKNNSSDEEGFNQFADRHRTSLNNISRRLGNERFTQASGLLEEAIEAHKQVDDLEGYKPFIALLLKHYYDPMYDYQLSKRQSEVLIRGDEIELLDWLQKQGVELQ